MTTSMSFWSFLVLLTWADFSEAYKILVVSSYPAGSHAILSDAYVELLLDAGHYVTYITALPKRNQHPNLNEIDLSSNFNNTVVANVSLKEVMKNEMGLSAIMDYVSASIKLHGDTINNPEVQKYIMEHQFDVIIAEWMFSELYAGLQYVLECPLIWFSTVEPHWMVLRLIDEQTNPSYNSDSFSSQVTPFTFYQRTTELIFRCVMYLIKDIYMYHYENIAYENIFSPLAAKKGKSLPSFQEVRYNASLMLGNSHVSLGEATRLPQNYIPIGGFHVERSVKRLPEDLKKIMDVAKYGVIFFSMGSILKSQDMSKEMKVSLLKLFAEFNQTVLWKFEEDFTDVPKNVHLLKWAPQQSILSHPNCILFISHGGLLSITEAINSGVPIIGVPGFADQFSNVRRAVKKGIALKVDLSERLAEDLRPAIIEVLSNSSYSKRVKEVSFIYHHRPVTPHAELVHWVEHVVKTGGAPHLRSPALHLLWYQKLYLDVILVLTIPLLALYIIIKRLRRIFLIKAKKSLKKVN